MPTSSSSNTNDSDNGPSPTTPTTPSLAHTIHPRIYTPNQTPIQTYPHPQPPYSPLFLLPFTMYIIQWPHRRRRPTSQQMPSRQQRLQIRIIHVVPQQHHKPRFPYYSLSPYVPSRPSPSQI
ncbi:hypothetical protein SERLADRAFT_364862 [Serpula lacrymans var. lacrymans S7.9]|uniref:Uncharacterized protein n=1 Tax=Serpula lacrymans var. lacrymans (strain S7.9) TaxID=578457 RepID=F8NEW8_SERL9|nr:uncharacterized protein SERLADRAFT_364862 [Serpula lacrymans var. lacrymans S7.9]EGO31116.1 hypothetical protein SERLADRAFT_364862 [Serpula lacrymans var. lacrymans S7.9]